MGYPSPMLHTLPQFYTEAWGRGEGMGDSACFISEVAVGGGWGWAVGAMGHRGA